MCHSTLGCYGTHSTFRAGRPWCGWALVPAPLSPYLLLGGRFQRPPPCLPAIERDHPAKPGVAWLPWGPEQRTGPHFLRALSPRTWKGRNEQVTGGRQPGPPQASVGGCSALGVKATVGPGLRTLQGSRFCYRRLHVRPSSGHAGTSESLQRAELIVTLVSVQTLNS